VEHICFRPRALPRSGPDHSRGARPRAKRRNYRGSSRDGIEEAEEGQVITVLHCRYERNSALVQAKKRRARVMLGKLVWRPASLTSASGMGRRGLYRMPPRQAGSRAENWVTRRRLGIFGCFAPTATAWSMRGDLGSRSKNW
jgi:hypothetical protein